MLAFSSWWQKMGVGQCPSLVCVCVGGGAGGIGDKEDNTHCRAGHSDSSQGSWLLQELTQSAAL